MLFKVGGRGGGQRSRSHAKHCKQDKDKTVGIEPSNLVHKLVIAREQHLLIVKVRGQRTRSHICLKICYDNPGNVPNKGRNFNTQKFGKMYLFVIVICMIRDDVL